MVILVDARRAGRTWRPAGGAFRYHDSGRWQVSAGGGTRPWVNVFDELKRLAPVSR